MALSVTVGTGILIPQLVASQVFTGGSSPFEVNLTGPLVGMSGNSFVSVMGSISVSSITSGQTVILTFTAKDPNNNVKSLSIGPVGSNDSQSISGSFVVKQGEGVHVSVSTSDGQPLTNSYNYSACILSL